jgi:hypothetical protein
MAAPVPEIMDTSGIFFHFSVPKMDPIKTSKMSAVFNLIMMHKEKVIQLSGYKIRHH